MGIAIAFIMIAVISNNSKADTRFYEVNHSGNISKELGGKGDALVALAKSNNSASIMKCQDVELDRKRGTIRTK